MELDRHCSTLLPRSPPRSRARRRGRDVVHAKERSPAVEGRHRRADRCRVAPDAARRDRRARARACSCARRRRAPVGPMRADPIEPAEQREVLRRRSCRSRFPGSRHTRSSGMPAATATASRSSRKAQTSPTTSSYRGATCIVRGSPCMCMRQTYAPASAITPARAGSPRSAVTSLTSRAPSASARRATSAFDVSIETGAADEPLEHRHDAPQLLVERHRVRAGSGRLTADVDERRTLVEQPARRRDRDRRVDVVPAVREAVGRDVDDSHHGGARPTLGERRSGHRDVEGR